MNTHTLDHDAVLAAIFDPQLTPADLPTKTGLSLHQLACWLKANAEKVNEVREFLTQRAALIGMRLQAASLAALDRVVRECPDLERVRKAASTILRSLKVPTNPTRKRGASCASESADSAHAKAPSPFAERSDPPIPQAPRAKAPSPAERLAAIRLAKLQAGRLVQTQ